MPEPFVTEERRFAWNTDEPPLPQLVRLAMEVRRFMGDSPDGQGVRIREIVVILERPVPQLRGR